MATRGRGRRVTIIPSPGFRQVDESSSRNIDLGLGKGINLLLGIRDLIRQEKARASKSNEHLKQLMSDEILKQNVSDMFKDLGINVPRPATADQARKLQEDTLNPAIAAEIERKRRNAALEESLEVAAEFRPEINRKFAEPAAKVDIGLRQIAQDPRVFQRTPLDPGEVEPEKPLRRDPNGSVRLDLSQRTRGPAQERGQIRPIPPLKGARPPNPIEQANRIRAIQDRLVKEGRGKEAALFLQAPSVQRKIADADKFIEGQRTLQRELRKAQFTASLNAGQKFFNNFSSGVADRLIAKGYGPSKLPPPSVAKQAILEDEEAQVERAKARGENAAALRFISPESQRGLIDLETGNDPSKRLTVKDLKDNQDRYAYVDPNIKDVDRNLRTQLPVLEKIMSLATKIFTDDTLLEQLRSGTEATVDRLVKANPDLSRFRSQVNGFGAALVQLGGQTSGKISDADIILAQQLVPQLGLFNQGREASARQLNDLVEVLGRMIRANAEGTALEPFASKRVADFIRKIGPKIGKMLEERPTERLEDLPGVNTQIEEDRLGG